MSVRLEIIPLAADERTFQKRRERGAACADLFGPVPRSDAELLALVRDATPNEARRSELHAQLRDLEQRGQLATTEAGANASAAPTSLDRLRDPKTLIVMAGQQPALAGGPLMIATKVASLIALARRLDRLGAPAVPIFWIADDDHDVDELRAGLLPRPGSPRWEFPNPFERGRAPISQLRLPDASRAALDEIARELDAGGSGTLGTLLRDSFTATPALWFERVLTRLFAGTGLICVRASSMRAAAAVSVRRELAKPGRLAGEATRVGERMRSCGLPVMVEKPAPLPFFYHDADQSRHRVSGDRERLQVENPARDELDSAAIDEALRDPAGKFSPDVLLRPLVEAWSFEPCAVVLGPAELAYQMQLAESYAPRGLARPLLIPRARLGVLDAEIARALEAEGISLSALTSQSTPEEIAPSPQAARVAREVKESAAPFLAKLESLAHGEESTHALARRAERLSRRLNDDVEKLSQAALREVSWDRQGARQAAQAALAELWPDGKPAERSYSVLHYLERYGLGLLLEIENAFDPFDERMRLMVIEEPPRKES